MSDYRRNKNNTHQDKYERRKTDQFERERSRSNIEHYKSPRNKTAKQIKIDIEDSKGDLDKTLTEEGIITSRQDLESQDNFVTNGRRNTTSVAKKGQNKGKLAASKFTSQSPQATLFNTQKIESVGDGSSNYEDEAFESMSMSKSMVGIGLGLGAKAATKKSVISSSNAQDDYSNEDFESVTMSKSITVSASNKVVPSKKKIGSNLVVPDKKKG